MISFTKEHHILEDENPYNMWVHQQDDMMIYEKGNVVFAFNFHPNRSFEGYFVPVSKAGKYHAVLTSDESRFGGQDRIAKDVVYNTVELPDGRTGFFAYLPSRTAAAFCRIEDAVSKKETAAAIPLFRFFYSIERAIFSHIHYMIILNNNSTPKSILF